MLAVLVFVWGTVWFVDSLAQLDPEDDVYSVSVGFAFIMYVAFVVFALVLGGTALLAFPANLRLRSAYFGGLGVVCIGAAMTFFRGTGLDVTALAIAAGSFYLIWRQTGDGWPRQAAVCGAILAGVLVLSVAPLVGMVLLGGMLAALVWGGRRGDDRLGRSRGPG